MSAKTTTAQLVTKPVQFIEEATEGTTPGIGSTTVLGVVSSISFKKDGQFIDIGQLGPEDLITIAKGPKKPESQIKYTMLNSTFLKYLVNAANFGIPAGTISITTSIIFVIYLNGIENFIVLKGSRPKGGSLSMDIGKETEVTVDLVHTTMALASATPPAGLTLTSTFPSGAVFDWTSGGANPLAWNTVAQNAVKFSCAINRKTKQTHTLGNRDPYSSQPHGRRISGDFTVLWTSTTLEADHDAGTARTLAVTLSVTPSVVLTITGAVIKTHAKDAEFDSEDDVVEKCDYGATGIIVT